MRLHIYLPEDLNDWLQDKAAYEVRSVSNLILSLLEKERRQDEQEVTADK